MLQKLQNIAKFQKIQLANLVDFEKCCKTRIFLQRSVPIQPKTIEILPKIGNAAADAGGVGAAPAWQPPTEPEPEGADGHGTETQKATVRAAKKAKCLQGFCDMFANVISESVVFFKCCEHVAQISAQFGSNLPNCGSSY